MAKQRLHTSRGSDSVTEISSQSVRTGRPRPENQEEIAALAHALWQARGCPDGSPEEDWFQAKQALAKRSGRQRTELPGVDRPILARQTGLGAV
jgi:Protein of unknown function (DUF2934)